MDRMDPNSGWTGWINTYSRRAVLLRLSLLAVCVLLVGIVAWYLYEGREAVLANAQWYVGLTLQLSFTLLGFTIVFLPFYFTARATRRRDAQEFARDFGPLILDLLEWESNPKRVDSSAEVNEYYRVVGAFLRPKKAQFEKGDQLENNMRYMLQWTLYAIGLAVVSSFVLYVYVGRLIPTDDGTFLSVWVGVNAGLVLVSGFMLFNFARIFLVWIPSPLTWGESYNDFLFDPRWLARPKTVGNVQNEADDQEVSGPEAGNRS